MAHCAKIENGVVTQVIVISNNYEPNVEQFATELFGGSWLQTSYNNNIRFNYAAVGYTYDEVKDAFIPPKCHDEAILDEAICRWECENAQHDITLS
jgi:hypothetical protein